MEQEIIWGNYFRVSLSINKVSNYQIINFMLHTVSGYNDLKIERDILIWTQTELIPILKYKKKQACWVIFIHYLITATVKISCSEFIYL